MKVKKLPLLFLGAGFLALPMQAQELKDSYIQWWPSQNTYLPDVMSGWKTSHRVTEDDNFFISRVKPKKRFTNQQTQVKKDLTAANDKRLLAWLPINNPSKNALPDGVFDSEVFSMWNYVSHWGNWTAPLGRVPASLLDVAHKNGVAVSGVWGIPWGTLSYDWAARIDKLNAQDVNEVAKYLLYYGQDGLGYNSEYNDNEGATRTQKLIKFHKDLLKLMREKNPIAEHLWYDLMSSTGQINAVNYLGTHNKTIFGEKGEEGFSMFLNYNWGSQYTLNQCIRTASSMDRDPLYLYAGCNMQGGQGYQWPTLTKFPISVGLWGAHERNMFWESRAEKGSSPEVMQRTYMLRTERWFTGGTRNPANTPELKASANYSADNVAFGGMSSMMTAKSTLSWNLTEEPFITYFNLGNGKFFNWMGDRQHDRSWYNIGVQDYLPTWRWWFSSDLLGTNVPAQGLDAEFVWDDAYVGGSCMRVFGNTAGSEYLHLFKTEYELQEGDVITVKFKHAAGSANAKVVLTVKGEEQNAILDPKLTLLSSDKVANDEIWQECKTTVGSNLDGKHLALIALQFDNASKLNLKLGEVSIVRGPKETPARPEITKASILAFNRTGVDGKIIFNMENDKESGTPCYNTDVKTSLFKLWAEQEGGQKQLMGITTSWAGMMYSIPMDVSLSSTKVRLGVQAVSLDMKSESEIAWSDLLETPEYVYSNDVQVNKSVIKPEEKFTMSYVDPRHEAGTWRLLDQEGNEVFRGEGKEVEVAEGLKKVGNYNLEVTGKVYQENGSVENKAMTYYNFLAVTSMESGALPEIYTLTANGLTENLDVEANDVINLKYTGRAADGKLSRGYNLKEKGLVFKPSEAGLSTSNTPWTMSFWLKFNTIASGSTQFLDMRDQFTSWPQNNWGCFWGTYGGKVLTITIRSANGSSNPEHRQDWNVEFKPGVWSHVTLAMEKTSAGVRCLVYINGKMAEPKEWKFGSTSGTGLIPNYTPTTAWWDNAYMMLGLGRHQCAAIDGVVDDVKFFNRTLSEQEVLAVMNEKDPNGHAPVAAWSFENEPGEDYWFANDAGTGSVKIARGEIKSAEGEGQGSVVAVEPNYDAGSPFAPGQKYDVTTTATWSAPKGRLDNEQGNGEQGSATLSYAEEGTYKVTLTLANSYGKATRVFQVITVGTPSSIGHVDAAEMKTYTVDRDIFVEFAEGGKYGIQVYAANGTLAGNLTRDVAAGSKVHVQVGTAGVYVLKVVKNGKTVHAAKLLCK